MQNDFHNRAKAFIICRNIEVSQAGSVCLSRIVELNKGEKASAGCSVKVLLQISGTVPLLLI